jgi:uncharacterized membrane protein YhaH (DUF805 family)
MISTLCALCLSLIMTVKWFESRSFENSSSARRRAARQAFLLRFLALYLFFATMMGLTSILLTWLIQVTPKTVNGILNCLFFEI